jgi:acetyl esterase
MAPSPSALEMLRRLDALHPKPFQELDPPEARREDIRTTIPFLNKPEPVEKIEDHTIVQGSSKIPARFYFPNEAEEADDGKGEVLVEEELYPIVMYFHGGGWVLGNLDEYDEICSMLSNHSKAIVVSVDYRLAPEHKFPAAIDDCYGATKWMAENARRFNGDDDTIIVSGDSAGGTLAIDVCLMARDNGNDPKIAMAVPLCPVTDLSRDMSKYSNDKFGPSKESMDWFIHHYVRNKSDITDPLASPQFANLGNLPYMILVSAELDTLREQEMDFMRKLEQAGVKTKLLDYEGMVHDFMVTPGYFKEGKDALEKISSEVRRIYVEND